MDGWMMRNKTVITSETENFTAVQFPKQHMLFLLVKFV